MKNSDDSLTPDHGVKRTHSEDGDEESTRRVARRTDNDSKPDPNAMLFRKFRLQDLQSENKKILAKTLDHIVSVLREDDEEADEEFFVLGGHEHVVRIMKDYINCKKLQEKVLNILIFATLDSEAFQAAIAEAGGLQALLAVLNRYHSDTAFVLTGLQILHQMCYFEVYAELLVTQTNGVAFLTKAFQTFRNDKQVVFECCSFLNCLVREQLRGPLIEANVVKCLKHAMQQYPNNVNIKRSAQSALNELNSL